MEDLYNENGEYVSPNGHVVKREFDGSDRFAIALRAIENDAKLNGDYRAARAYYGRQEKDPRKLDEMLERMGFDTNVGAPLDMDYLMNKEHDIYANENPAIKMAIKEYRKYKAKQKAKQNGRK